MTCTMAMGISPDMTILVTIITQEPTTIGR